MPTERDYKAYVLYGEYPGRDWDDWCQAFVWNLCNTYGKAPVIYPTATAAQNASNIVSRNPEDAPAGTFHYWQPYGIPAGHVAIGLGNGQCAMAVDNYLLDEVWGLNVGKVDVADYTARTGAHYVGWSYTNGANDVPDMSTSQARSVANTLTNKESFLMALSDAQQKQALEWSKQLKRSASLANWGVNDNKGGIRVMLSWVLNEIRKLDSIDEAMLAQAVAAEVELNIEDAVTTAGSGATAEQIADEISKRLAE